MFFLRNETRLRILELFSRQKLGFFSHSFLIKRHLYKKRFRDSHFQFRKKK